MSPGRVISNRNFLTRSMRPLHGWRRRCRIFIVIYQQDTSNPVGVTSSPADAAPMGLKGGWWTGSYKDAAPNGAKNMPANKNPPGE
jgi:hypothetical protein